MRYDRFELNPAPRAGNPHNWELVLRHNKHQSSAWQLEPKDLEALHLLLIAYQEDINRAIEKQDAGKKEHHTYCIWPPTHDGSCRIPLSNGNFGITPAPGWPKEATNG